MIVKSLKDSILEHLHMHKGGAKTASANIRKASHDFAGSDAPQFRGKSAKKRQQMAVAAGLGAARGESVERKGKSLTEAANPVPMKVGDTVLYQGRPVKVQSFNEQSGFALVKPVRKKEPVYAKITDLTKHSLNEGVLGLAPIGFTYVEPPRSQLMRLEDLSPEDIGLIFEKDDEDEDDDSNADEEDTVEDKDGQEEDYDNGSNVRHDGHTGKTEIDNLPTPSDTIAPAYSDDIPPKEVGTPLSIEKGAEEAHLWDAPEWDGYDYPADAPEIPTADFPGEEMGNARAPDQAAHHDAGDTDTADDGESGVGDGDGDDDDEKNEFATYRRKFDFILETFWKSHDAAVRRSKKLRENAYLGEINPSAIVSQEAPMTEIDDKLDDDTEPTSESKVTLTLPALASVVCTAVNKCQGDETMMKAMIEALAEVGKGKTLDVDDLEAVARHVNGEEEQEVENRDDGQPPHSGMETDHGHLQGDSGEGGAHDGSDWEPPEGDGEPDPNGKTKLMGGGEFGESVNESAYVSWYGSDDDILKEVALSDEDELRLIKKRAGMKYW